MSTVIEIIICVILILWGIVYMVMAAATIGCLQQIWDEIKKKN